MSKVDEALDQRIGEAFGYARSPGVPDRKRGV